MVKEPYSFSRLARFYRRNDTAFWCVGLFIVGHLFWWQVQQNRAFVEPHERRRTLGPIPIPYIDEILHKKKADAAEINSNATKANKD